MQDDSGPTDEQQDTVDPQRTSHNEPVPCVMSPHPWELFIIAFIKANVLMVEVVTEQYQIGILNANQNLLELMHDFQCLLFIF